MDLGVRDGNTVIALTLAHLALGQKSEALTLLRDYREVVHASDAGLALALAGASESATYILAGAARQQGAEDRPRQNLALAFPLSGGTPQAPTVASQNPPQR